MAPQTTEWRAEDLRVVEGQIPTDLDGIYLRNTENPLHPAMKFYHLRGRRHAAHRRVPGRKGVLPHRFVRTDAFEAEQQAGESLWPGLAEPLSLAKADHGWGPGPCSRTPPVPTWWCTAVRTDQFLPVRRPVPPRSLPTPATRWADTWNDAFPFDWGVSGPPKVDERTEEMLFFNYSKNAPYLHRVVDAHNDLVHYVDVELPGPRLPHDMAFTRNYAILNDFPLFWEPELLDRNLHVARFHRDLPSRFAVIPRRGTEVAWFEADPTFVLHFTNAYEDGDEIVLDGFHQGTLSPPMTACGGTRWQTRLPLLPWTAYRPACTGGASTSQPAQYAKNR